MRKRANRGLPNNYFKNCAFWGIGAAAIGGVDPRQTFKATQGWFFDFNPYEYYDDSWTEGKPGLNETAGIDYRWMIRIRWSSIISTCARNDSSSAAGATRLTWSVCAPVSKRWK